MSLKSRWPGVKRAVLRRDGETCQCCGRPATDVHHRKARGMGSTSDEAIYLGPANLIALCRTCHDTVHRNPDWACARGFIVRTGYDPESIPVRTITGLVWLTPAGGRVTGKLTKGEPNG